MFSYLRNYFRPPYVAHLESELARLRAENRALMNSLLGTAGFPPLEFPEPAKPVELPRLRRRSWHQIQALRESQTSRTTHATITDTPASPHSPSPF